MSTKARRNGVILFAAGFVFFSVNFHGTDEGFAENFLKSGFNVTDRAPTDCEILSSLAMRRYNFFLGLNLALVGLFACNVATKRAVRLLLVSQLIMSVSFLYDYTYVYPDMGYSDELANKVKMAWFVCFVLGSVCLLYDLVIAYYETKDVIPPKDLPAGFRSKTPCQLKRDQLVDDVYFAFWQRDEFQRFIPSEIRMMTGIVCQIVSIFCLILFAMVYFLYTSLCGIVWVITLRGNPFEVLAPFSFLAKPTVVISGRLRVWLLHLSKMPVFNNYLGINTWRSKSGDVTFNFVFHLAGLLLFSFVDRNTICEASGLKAFVSDRVFEVITLYCFTRCVCVVFPIFLQFEFLIEYILANQFIKDPSVYVEFLISEFGSFYPFGNGIGVSKHAMVKKLMEDTQIRKSNNSLGWKVSNAQYKFSDRLTIFYPQSELDKTKVTEGREVVRIWIEDVIKDLNNPQTITKIEYAIPYPPEDGTMLDEDLIGLSFGITFFHLLTGGHLTKKEVESYERLAIKLPLAFLPDWFNFLVNNAKGRKESRHDYEAIRAAIVRYPEAPALQRTLAVARKKGWGDTDTIRFLSMVFCIAGAAAPAKLTAAVVKRIHDRTSTNLALYNKNPYNFITETARLDKAVPGVHVFWHGSEELSITLDGKTFLVPEGTPLNLSILMANRDTDAFGEYADEFNPERPTDQLFKMLTWNGTKDLFSSPGKKPPRGCPGHDISLAIIKFLVDIYKPSGDKLTSLISNERIKEIRKIKLTQHVRMMLEGAKRTNTKWNSKFPLASDVDHPKDIEQKHLKFIPLPFGDPERDTLPTHDEDRIADKSIILKKMLLACVPLEDKSDDWKSPGEAVGFRIHLFDNLYPRPNIVYNEVTSDKAVVRIAFAGYACFHTKELKDSSDDIVWRKAPSRAHYVNHSCQLQDYKVRQGYQKYGAAAYFDKNFNLVGIYTCFDQKLVSPPEDAERDSQFYNMLYQEEEPSNSKQEWEHAKWVWKVSAFAWVTVVDHMGYTHLIEANALVSATRKHLSVDHPFRALCKIFTYSTVAVNYHAHEMLFNRKGFVERIWKFETEELQKIIKELKNLYKFETLPEKIHPTMRGVDPKKYPANKDAMKFWDVMYKFVHDYLCVIYSKSTNDVAHSETDDVFLFDAPMQKCLKDICYRLNITKIRCEDPNCDKVHFNQAVDIFTHLFCTVTAMHEHVGQVSDYTANPLFVGATIRPDLEIDSIQTNCLLNALVSSTGVRMPKLLNNWEHLLEADIFECHTVPIMRKFQEDLLKLSEEIDQDNKVREPEFQLQSFNPRILESSLSV